MEAGLGEASLLVEIHLFILFYFWVADIAWYLLKAQTWRIAFLTSQTRLAPACLAWVLSKLCLLRRQHPHRPSAGLDVL